MVAAALEAPGAGADLTWIKVIDQERCIGCHACTVACKSENRVPLGVTRTYVKNVEVGTYPGVRELAEMVGSAGSRLATHTWRAAAAGNLGAGR